MVTDVYRLQRILQIGRRVSFAYPRGDSVPKDLAAGMLDPVGCLDGTARLDPPQALK